MVQYLCGSGFTPPTHLAIAVQYGIRDVDDPTIDTAGEVFTYWQWLLQRPLTLDKLHHARRMANTLNQFY